MSPQLETPLVNTLSRVESTPVHFQWVVAHYCEDLAWLSPVKEDCVVYSKGGPDKAPILPFTELANIGREGHTYLHHIVERYDTLADITLFSQGNVDDHICLTAVEMKEKALTTRPGEVTTFPFRELEVFDHWEGIPYEEYPCWSKWAKMETKLAPKTPAEYFVDFFGNGRVPISIGYQPCANFAVTRETIHKHPRDYYLRLLADLFKGDMAHVNPGTGAYMERFWLVMFNPEEYCLWEESQKSEKKRNGQGQLAKGRWHRTPKWIEFDPALKDPRDENRKII